MEKVNVIWFEYDLRIHDHEGLYRAHQMNLPTIGVYIFNPSDFEVQTYGFPKIGDFRFKFIYESLLNLKANLKQLNIPLLVFFDEVGHVFSRLNDVYQIDHIFTQTAYGNEELKRQEEVKKIFLSSTLIYYDQKPLYHHRDLPMDVFHIPDVFTAFRQKIEKHGFIRKTYSIPATFNVSSTSALEDDFESISKRVNTHVNLIFSGGETNAIQRVSHYFFETQKLKVYKLTRNQMLNFDDSSKLSPYLALGCISPRYVYEQLQLYEKQYVKNVSTYWLYFELVWRDYFHFIHMKYKNKIFHQNGLFNQKVKYTNNVQHIKAWQEGKTGYPLVDANMIELKQTGWMSNRGRQNVANFFAKYINQDWRIGAAWFECLLIDYDVSSNYGNWQYQAGVGVDPRQDRLFDVTWQGEKYDQDTRYLRKWLPSFQKIPKDKRYQVMTLSVQEQAQYGFILGKDYPLPICEKPIIKPKKEK